jgi:hypothetical protein
MLCNKGTSETNTNKQLTVPNSEIIQQATPHQIKHADDASLHNNYVQTTDTNNE